ncbi:MAG: hypothetical protein AAGA93_14980 [Actinomycetota bacterium]
MNIEQRLTDHMAEQSERLSFPAGDPSEITHRPPSGQSRAAVLVVAALVVVAGGFGFLALSGGDDATEIAAGQNDTDDDSTDDGATDGDSTDGDSTDDAGSSTDEGSGLGGPFVGLDVVDVTSESSPGAGQVVADGGVYYVLATAPGRVRLDEVSEADWERVFRANTFYSLADGQWQANEVEDRFISEFQIDDGVIYVLSTGTVSGGQTLSYGTSSDRGQSWSWQELGGVPPTTSVAMLRQDDGLVAVASRAGYPDYNQVLSLARGAGVDVTEMTLRNFDHDGFSYIPADPDNPCAAVFANYGLADYAEWLRTAPEDERERAREDLTMMLGELSAEFEEAGCPIDVESIDSIPVPEVANVQWADIGVAVPEAWTPWNGVFRLQGDQLTELPNPFQPGEQIGFLSSTGDQLVVDVYPTEAMPDGTESRLTTSDGVNWDRGPVNYEDDWYFYGPAQQAPRIGDTTFRVHWMEPTDEEIQAYEEQAAAFDRGEIEAIDEAMFAAYETPLLQRSVAGGPWEDLDPSEFLGIDVGDRNVQQVVGTDYGVFLLFINGGLDGPPEPGVLVVYSNNGTDWGSFQTSGDWVSLFGADDSVLAFDNRWIQTETGGREESTALLLTPTG